jgi:hypothetical protein
MAQLMPGGERATPDLRAASADCNSDLSFTLKQHINRRTSIALVRWHREGEGMAGVVAGQFGAIRCRDQGLLNGEATPILRARREPYFSSILIIAVGLYVTITVSPIWRLMLRKRLSRDMLQVLADRTYGRLFLAQVAMPSTCMYSVAGSAGSAVTSIPASVRRTAPIPTSMAIPIMSQPLNPIFAAIST